MEQENVDSSARTQKNNRQACGGTNFSAGTCKTSKRGERAAKLPRNTQPQEIQLRSVRTKDALNRGHSHETVDLETVDRETVDRGTIELKQESDYCRS